MSDANLNPAPAPPSWQQLQFRWGALPGWGLSLAVHCLFLLLLGSSMQSCGRSVTGDGQGDFRQVGLVSAADALDDASAEPSAQDDTQESSTTVTPTAVPEVPQQPPTEVSIPDSLNPLVGPGTIAPPTSFGNPSETVLKPSSVGPFSPSVGNAGDGSVDFLGAADKGTSFLYVIDCSGSMGDYQALDYAKAEMLASLQRMSSAQKFQVMFYNEHLNVMSLNNAGENRYYPATDQNRSQAKRFIQSVRPALGTRHLPALLQGLAMKPDVLFFLSDAGTGLSAAEVDQVRKANRHGTHIHCIEFGIGNASRVENFLSRLAAQNNGTHSYRDISKLGKQP